MALNEKTVARIKTKRAKKKSAATSTPSTPYSPTSVTTYPNESAFNRGVDTRARGQLQPGLSDVRARRREELGAHEARTRDIQGYYDYDLAARQAGQTRLQEALTGILNRNDVMGAGAQEGLAAALRQASAPNDAAAAQLGVGAAPVDPQLAASLGAYSKGNAMGLAGEFGNHLALGAADIGLTGVERREAGDRETGEHAANLKGLTNERTELMKTLPGLREGARASMLQEILANSQNKLAWRQFGEGRRSSKVQEGLAKDQFDLTGEQFTESKRARKFDEGQARIQSKLNQDQLNLARDELNAKIDQAQTEEEAKGAETMAKQFDSAAEWLTGWLAPNDQDKAMRGDPKKPVFSPKLYNRRVNNGFHDALVQLMTRFGLDRSTAYKVLSTATPYRKKAEKFSGAWDMRNRPT